jgi:hypothetical protein
MSKSSVNPGPLVSIEHPATGIWQSFVTGTGNFTLSAYGTSSLHFLHYTFVELRGRPGHEGCFDVTKIPPPGSDYTSLAIIEGDYSNVNFDFRALDGTPLGAFNLTVGSGEDFMHVPKNYFYGNVTIPRSAFYVYVSREDANGALCQRVVPGVFDNLSEGNRTLNSTTGLNGTSIVPPYSNSTGLSGSSSSSPSAAYYPNLTDTSISDLGPNCLANSSHGAITTTVR